MNYHIAEKADAYAKAIIDRDPRIEISCCVETTIHEAFEHLRKRVGLKNWSGWKLFVDGAWGDCIEIETDEKETPIPDAAWEYMERLGFEPNMNGKWILHATQKGQPRSNPVSIEPEYGLDAAIAVLQRTFPQRDIRAEIFGRVV